MKVIISKGGYFYKVYKNGKKKRISKDYYTKLKSNTKSKQNKNGNKKQISKEKYYKLNIIGGNSPINNAIKKTKIYEAVFSKLKESKLKYNHSNVVEMINKEIQKTKNSNIIFKKITLNLINVDIATLINNSICEGHPLHEYYEYLSNKDPSLKLIRKLGQGAYSVVYSATVTKPLFKEKLLAENMVSVKILNFQKADEELKKSDKEFRELYKISKSYFLKVEAYKIIKEVEMALKLSGHPCILRTFGLFTLDFPFTTNERIVSSVGIVTEYLHRFIDLLTYMNISKMTYEKKYVIIYQLLNIVKYLSYKKVMHRDLKPENILINMDTLEIKIIDYGFVTENQFNRREYGTPIYMCPQILKTVTDKNLFYNRRVDVWSLGVTIFEILANRHFFTIKKLNGKKIVREEAIEQVKGNVLGCINNPELIKEKLDSLRMSNNCQVNESIIDMLEKMLNPNNSQPYEESDMTIEAICNESNEWMIFLNDNIKEQIRNRNQEVGYCKISSDFLIISDKMIYDVVLERSSITIPFGLKFSSDMFIYIGEINMNSISHKNGSFQVGDRLMKLIILNRDDTVLKVIHCELENTEVLKANREIIVRALKVRYIMERDIPINQVNILGPAENINIRDVTAHATSHAAANTAENLHRKEQYTVRLSEETAQTVNRPEETA